MTRSLSKRCIRLDNDFCLSAEQVHRGGVILLKDQRYKILYKSNWSEVSPNKKQKSFVVGNGLAIYRYEIFKEKHTHKKYFTIIKKVYPKYAYRAELVGCDWQYKKSKPHKEPRFRIPDYTGK